MGLQLTNTFLSFFSFHLDILDLLKLRNAVRLAAVTVLFSVWSRSPFIFHWKVLNMLFHVTILSFLNLPSQQRPPAFDLGQLEMNVLHFRRTRGDFNHALLC